MEQLQKLLLRNGYSETKTENSGLDILFLPWCKKFVLWNLLNFLAYVFIYTISVNQTSYRAF